MFSCSSSSLLRAGLVLLLVSAAAGVEQCDDTAGIKGLPGLKGPKGPDSTVKGAKGARGPAGPRGPKGFDGLNGAKGAKGAKGSVGPDGGAGPQGIRGPIGAKGPLGFSATDKPVGFNAHPDADNLSPGSGKPTRFASASTGTEFLATSQLSGNDDAVIGAAKVQTSRTPSCSPRDNEDVWAAAGSNNEVEACWDQFRGLDSDTTLPEFTVCRSGLERHDWCGCALLGSCPPPWINGVVFDNDDDDGTTEPGDRSNERTDYVVVTGADGLDLDGYTLAFYFNQAYFFGQGLVGRLTVDPYSFTERQRKACVGYMPAPIATIGDTAATSIPPSTTTAGGTVTMHEDTCVALIGVDGSVVDFVCWGVSPDTSFVASDGPANNTAPRAFVDIQSFTTYNRFTFASPNTNEAGNRVTDFPATPLSSFVPDSEYNGNRLDDTTSSQEMYPHDCDVTPHSTQGLSVCSCTACGCVRPMAYWLQHSAAWPLLDHDCFRRLGVAGCLAEDKFPDGIEQYCRWPKADLSASPYDFSFLVSGGNTAWNGDWTPYLDAAGAGAMDGGDPGAPSAVDGMWDETNGFVGSDEAGPPLCTGYVPTGLGPGGPLFALESDRIGKPLIAHLTVLCEWSEAQHADGREFSAYCQLLRAATAATLNFLDGACNNDDCEACGSIMQHRCGTVYRELEKAWALLLNSDNCMWQSGEKRFHFELQTAYFTDEATCDTLTHPLARGLETSWREGLTREITGTVQASERLSFVANPTEGAVLTFTASDLVDCDKGWETNPDTNQPPHVKIPGSVLEGAEFWTVAGLYRVDEQDDISSSPFIGTDMTLFTAVQTDGVVPTPVGSDALQAGRLLRVYVNRDRICVEFGADRTHTGFIGLSEDEPKCAYIPYYNSSFADPHPAGQGWLYNPDCDPVCDNEARHIAIVHAPTRQPDLDAYDRLELGRQTSIYVYLDGVEIGEVYRDRRPHSMHFEPSGGIYLGVNMELNDDPALAAAIPTGSFDNDGARSCTPFSGTMDNLRFYKRALGPSEVLFLSGTSSSPDLSGPVNARFYCDIHHDTVHETVERLAEFSGGVTALPPCQACPGEYEGAIGYGVTHGTCGGGRAGFEVDPHNDFGFGLYYVQPELLSPPGSGGTVDGRPGSCFEQNIDVSRELPCPLIEDERPTCCANCRGPQLAGVASSRKRGRPFPPRPEDFDGWVVPVMPAFNVVFFYTEATRDGDIGGLAGADDLCRAEAETYGWIVPGNNTVAALLATGSGHLANRAFAVTGERTAYVTPLPDKSLRRVGAPTSDGIPYFAAYHYGTAATEYCQIDESTGDDTNDVSVWTGVGAVPTEFGGLGIRYETNGNAGATPFGTCYDWTVPADYAPAFTGVNNGDPLGLTWNVGSVELCNIPLRVYCAAVLPGDVPFEANSCPNANAVATTTTLATTTSTTMATTATGATPATTTTTTTGMVVASTTTTTTSTMATPATTAAPACLRVWVSSTSANGRLGAGSATTAAALAAADAVCQSEGNTLDNSKTYKAWLSTSTVDAKDRVGYTGAERYCRPDGTTEVIATGELLIATSSTSHGSKINTLSNGASSGNIGVWTGTTETGEDDKTCADWTSINDQGGMPVTGRTGNTNSDKKAWTSNSDTPCNVENPWYCFQLP